MIRLFSYGFLSVILAIYLSSIGLSDVKIGLLFSLTLLGDVFVSMWVTTKADKFGRKRMLILGSILMAITGIIFVFCKNPIVLNYGSVNSFL